MLVSLILTSLIESFSMGPRPMSCSFPAVAPNERPIEIVMKARPSLKDLPGLYRVEMAIDGKGINASAQPIIATEGRDVLVRASRGGGTFYAVGFDETGAAALNVVRAAPDGHPESQVTRRGICRNHQQYIQSWSAS